jgi:hypothetical protein
MKALLAFAVAAAFSFPHAAVAQTPEPDECTGFSPVPPGCPTAENAVSGGGLGGGAGIGQGAADGKESTRADPSKSGAGTGGSGASCTSKPGPEVIMEKVSLPSMAYRLTDPPSRPGLVAPIHSFLIPKDWAAGGVMTTVTPGSWASANMEISISKCPGDMKYYRTDENTFQYSWAKTKFHPCGQVGSAESNSLHWGAEVGQNTCRVTADEDWYVNIRMTGETGIYTCPSNFVQGCPYIYSFIHN